jgi:hypothetical protein
MLPAFLRAGVPCGTSGIGAAPSIGGRRRGPSRSKTPALSVAIHFL